MLTYMEVHLYYTLPVVFVLCALMRPFYSPHNGVKLTFLTLIAFVTASAWDNYIVYHRAWSYCPTCVTAVIGYVPLEEYMFFVIMTVMTVTFTDMVMRWRLTSFFIRPNTPLVQSAFVRVLPSVTLLGIAVKAWALAIPNTQYFYGGSILWYAFPVLGLLWSGAGEYICRRWVEVMVSIIVPTIYLCWVDKVAIAAQTWQISLRTSTGRMVAPHLPLEEAAFFFLINTVLVFATCAMDRAQAILHLYVTYKATNLHPSNSLFDRFHWLLSAFWCWDQDLEAKRIDDLRTSWKILRNASASFYTASAVFPTEARQDLGVLYGFCRATDDLIDDDSKSVAERSAHLNTLRTFVHDMFSQKTNQPAIEWSCYNKLPDHVQASMRSFIRLRHVLDANAVLELLDGYAWDLERRQVKTKEDLLRYSACVASSVGEMCTRVLVCSGPGYTELANMDWVLEQARTMGLVLQLTNIARDIVTDSVNLGRSYLPIEWLSEDEHKRLLAGDARALGDQRLKQLAHRLIDMADAHYDTSTKAISHLPSGCQAGIYAACNVYRAIGTQIRRSPTYPTRAFVPRWSRSWIALKCMYGFSSNTHNPPSHYRKGHIRNFIA